MKSRFLILASLTVIILTACGSNDAKVESRDKTGAALLNMPDGFPTVAMKCDGRGHRIYVPNKGSGDVGGIAVIDDASCRKVGP